MSFSQCLPETSLTTDGCLFVGGFVGLFVFWLVGWLVLFVLFYVHVCAHSLNLSRCFSQNGYVNTQVSPAVIPFAQNACNRPKHSYSSNTQTLPQLFLNLDIVLLVCFVLF